jgi:hypothetical protein
MPRRSQSSGSPKARTRWPSRTSLYVELSSPSHARNVGPRRCRAEFSKTTNDFSWLWVAGELGFEPRQTESESVVLPLHHSPRFLNKFRDLIGIIRVLAADEVSPAQMRRRSSRYLPALASGCRCRSRDKAKARWRQQGRDGHASKRWIPPALLWVS